jgi:2-haloacid dehalogenase
MTLNRRRVLALTAGGLATGLLTIPTSTQANPRRQFQAVAFDAFPIFDPRPILALAETLFPGKGAMLSDAWRTRQFEYQWLHALAGRYVDFWRTTEDALVFAAKLLQLELTPEKRAQLMQAHLELRAWPEVPAALHSLREAGVRLAFLSNMTTKMLETGIRNAGLEGLFEHVLSTDQRGTYKPDPRAYQLAVDAFKLARGDIVFAASAGWDAAGAKWFGYPTVWVNRLHSPGEEFGVAPDAMGDDLTSLVRFVNSDLQSR